MSLSFVMSVMTNVKILVNERIKKFMLPTLSIIQADENKPLTTVNNVRNKEGLPLNRRN